MQFSLLTFSALALLSLAACGSSSSNSEGGNPQVATQSLETAEPNSLIRDLPPGSVFEFVVQLEYFKPFKFAGSFYYRQGINIPGSDIYFPENRSKLICGVTVWTTDTAKMPDRGYLLEPNQRVAVEVESINDGLGIFLEGDDKPIVEMTVSKVGATVREFEEECFGSGVRVLVPRK